MPRLLTLNFANNKFYLYRSFQSKIKNYGVRMPKLFTYKVKGVFVVYHAFGLLKTVFIWRIQVK